MVNLQKDKAYNTPNLVISLPFFPVILEIFLLFFLVRWGPPAGGGPRHVPIVPRPIIFGKIHFVPITKMSFFHEIKRDGITSLQTA